MESAVEKVLIEALDALEAGDDVEAIIARYPQHEAELRPMLLTAASMAELRVAHSLEAQAISRQRMLDYAAASDVAISQTPTLLLVLRRLSLVVASLVIVLSLLGTGMLFASAETVPGDQLYDAKRLFEDARLSITGDSAVREALQQRNEEERIREIETLLRMGRSSDVTFTGLIEAINEDTWLVAGLQVTIVSATSMDGTENPAVGQLVQITGLTEDGRIMASTVMIRGVGNLPLPTPEAETTETPITAPSPTRTPTPTATPTETPTPTSTATVDRIPPAETPTQTSTPTATPTVESNENGNSNDNENEGGGNSNVNEESNGNQGDNGNGNDEDQDNDNEDDEAEDNENEDGEDNQNEAGNGNDDNDNDDDDESENNDNQNRNENRNGNSARLQWLAI
jgi:hypothetical protein